MKVVVHLLSLISSEAMTSEREKTALYELDLQGLERFVALLDQPAYRARQIWRWLYVAFVSSFDEMTDLPLTLRERLAERARLHTLELVTLEESQESPASKFLFRMEDGQMIETVLMHYLEDSSDRLADEGGEASGDSEAGEGLSLDPDPDPKSESDPASTGQASKIPPGRHTVCLSTQAGCAMGCVFCATGQMGLLRDLSVGECVEQLVICARILVRDGETLSNVVFMGMGEPLANWEATWGTVERLTDTKGFALSPRRLTISTVGIVPGIERLASAGKPVRLAVSLHAPDNALRSQLVAVNRTYGLPEILEACREYQHRGGRRITFEYVLIDGINDSEEQAAQLAQKARRINAHFNLIPLNPTEGSPMRPSRYDQAFAFEAVLREAGFSTTLRMRRGIDIQAGCGQLRSRSAEGLMGRTIPLEAIE
jgi:23S rRNA (adenine2503-C2)-methyltransferase